MQFDREGLTTYLRFPSEHHHRIEFRIGHLRASVSLIHLIDTK
jgi:hypothetical protein